MERSKVIRGAINTNTEPLFLRVYIILIMDWVILSCSSIRLLELFLKPYFSIGKIIRVNKGALTNYMKIEFMKFCEELNANEVCLHLHLCI